MLIKLSSYYFVDGDVVAVDGDVVAIDGDVVANDGDVVVTDGDVVVTDGDVVAIDGDVVVGANVDVPGAPGVPVFAQATILNTNASNITLTNNLFILIFPPYYFCFIKTNVSLLFS
jgi:hypothetical protein